MAQKCRACGRFTNLVEGVKCTKCAIFYHRACVNIPKEAKISPCWQSPECKVHTPRKDNTDDPVRGEGSDYGLSPGNPVFGDDVAAEILKEVRLHRAETKSFREDFDGLRAVVAAFDARLGDVESRLAALELKCSESQPNPEQYGNAEVEILRSSVEQLRSELNDRDQDAFANDLEISGIPEEQGENLGHLVGIIATKLGVTCEERDIVSVERTGARRALSSGAGDQSAPTAARPRPLVLRVARRQLRDSLLQAARARRGITTDGMGLAAAATRFYLNERLSRFNKMLFYKARELAGSRGWKYVWTRGGRIFVRRESGMASFRVRSEQDLKKISGVDGK